MNKANVNRLKKLNEAQIDKMKIANAQTLSFEKKQSYAYGFNRGTERGNYFGKGVACGLIGFFLTTVIFPSALVNLSYINLILLIFSNWYIVKLIGLFLKEANTGILVKFIT